MLHDLIRHMHLDACVINIPYGTFWHIFGIFMTKRRLFLCFPALCFFIHYIFFNLFNHTYRIFLLLLTLLADSFIFNSGLRVTKNDPFMS